MGSFAPHSRMALAKPDLLLRCMFSVLLSPQVPSRHLPNTHFAQVTSSHLSSNLWGFLRYCSSSQTLVLRFSHYLRREYTLPPSEASQGQKGGHHREE